MLRRPGRHREAGELLDVLFREADAARGSSDSFMIWLAATYAAVLQDVDQTEVALDLMRCSPTCARASPTRRNTPRLLPRP